MSLQLLWATGSGKSLEGEGSICITYESGSSTENLRFKGDNMVMTMKSGSEFIIGKEETAEPFYRFSHDGDISFSKAGTNKETVLRLKNEKLEIQKRNDKDSSTTETGLANLIPDEDNTYDLGSSGTEWKDLYIDGTANIDSLAMGTTVTSIKDEDNMSSDSATALATQQSIKKYVDDNAGGGGTVDKNLSNSSTNAVRNSAVHAGLATKNDTIDASNRLDASLIGAKGNVSNTEYGYLASVSSDIQTQLNDKLNLSGGTMTGLIQPIVATVKSAPNKNTIDARATNVFQFNSKQAITIDQATALYAGQEMTIVNLGQGAITITHSGKPAQTSFFIYGGKNLTIATGQVYKFVFTDVNQWLLIQ